MFLRFGESYIDIGLVLIKILKAWGKGVKLKPLSARIATFKNSSLIRVVTSDPELMVPNDIFKLAPPYL